MVVRDIVEQRGYDNTDACAAVVCLETYCDNRSYDFVLLFDFAGSYNIF